MPKITRSYGELTHTVRVNLELKSLVSKLTELRFLYATSSKERH